MSKHIQSTAEVMPRRYYFIALVPLALLPTLTVAQTATEVGVEKRVEALLGRMTLEEKLGQLAQYRGEWSDTGPKVPEGGEEEIRTGKVGSFLGVHGAEYTRQMQELAVEESRLQVPLLFAQDVIHGFRTIFPMPIAEACSWDPQAVEKAARIAAIEASAHGLHWTFAPVCDIARDPRWGRVAEGAGEDPYLCSVLAAARVRGFQGDDLSAPDTMLACAKHFAAYGAAEGGRDYNTVDISPQTLHGIYLPPFHAAVRAGAETIMASFNEVNGTPAHANRMLMTDILRGEWGFRGLVVSDYTGVLELMAHGVAADRAAAGILALEAGIDVDMVSGIFIDDLPEAVRDGRLDEQLVDDAVRRVLRAKYKLGLFDDPFKYHDTQREEAVTLTPEHRQFARDYAGQCVVLLKNEQQTLPLDRKAGTIAVVGPLADDARVMLGGWAMNGRAEDAVTILQGIKKAVGSDTTVLHAQGAAVEGDDRSGFEEAERIARQADVIVLVVGEHHDMSSEAHNRTSLDLPGVQQELAEKVHATGKPVVAVLVGGRPLSVRWLDAHVPAIVEGWFLGIEMGHAVADVLFGDVNPSGKLTVTFPRTVGQVPIYYNHKSTGRPPTEDNKYTSKYIDLPWTPLYPFGHGLSYTKFEYGELKLDAEQIRADEQIAASIDVSNVGDRAGTEVVQLYVRDEVGSVTPVVQQLRGFERVHLAPGETKTVEFRLGPGDLALYDADMQWVVEPGYFTVMAGGSSADVATARFEVVE
jgi:beta-glucosidase